MALGDVVDKLLDQNGLAHASAAEQADLAALCIRCEQIDNLDAGHQNFGLGGLVNKQRCLGVDWRICGRVHGALFIDRLTDHVQDAAQSHRPNRNSDLRASISDWLSTGQAVGRVHRDCTHGVLT